MSNKKSREIGAFKASGQDRLNKLTEYVIDQIYEITKEELTKIYPEKNWFEDNFASNLFLMALQVCGNIQNDIVQRRAAEVTEGRGNE